MVKLFVVGFPRDMQADELAEIFGGYGIVEKAMIVTDEASGESKGYGFVDMQGPGGARDVIAALDGATIDDRVISVRIKESKTPARKIFSPGQKRSSRPRPEYPKQEQGGAAGKKKRPRL